MEQRQSLCGGVAADWGLEGDSSVGSKSAIAILWFSGDNITTFQNVEQKILFKVWGV